LDYADFVFYDTNPFIEKYWEDTEHTYDSRGIEPRDQFIENELEVQTLGFTAMPNKI
jgi:hypothetical protein